MTNTWFDTARFGMFVHWGHSSQQGIELSWPLVGEVFAFSESHAVPVEQYHSTAATFDPRQYDPKAWAQMAKRAGMRYAVITTKHHDGYAMFDSKHTDYSVMHSPYGKDIVREFADAMRAEGIRVGFYFSLIDWHDPDYPAFTQADQPYKFPGGKPIDPERWPRFIERMFGQVRELMTNYGTVDVIWFDGGWERSAEQWRVQDLRKMMLELQPNLLINDRLPGAGDFDTPEQFVPSKPPPRAWEACMTINESWGYNTADKHFKSPRRLIHSLCEIAGRGGNLLLNVSPMGDGRLQPELAERIAVIEQWMSNHRESILDTTPGLEPWQFYGPSTEKDGTVYLHCLMRPYTSVSVRGIRIKRVKSVRALGSGSGTALAFRGRCSIIDMFANPDPVGELTITVPESSIDEHATVIALEMADKPV